MEGSAQDKNQHSSKTISERENQGGAFLGVCLARGTALLSARIHNTVCPHDEDDKAQDKSGCGPLYIVHSLFTFVCSCMAWKALQRAHAGISFPSSGCRRYRSQCLCFFTYI